MNGVDRLQLKTIALAIAAALLFGRVLVPAGAVPPLLASAILAAVTVPLTWWLVIGRGGDVNARRDRFGAAGRFYVLAFLAFLGGVALQSGLATTERVSIGARLLHLGVDVVVAYWLGYRGHYRTVLARLRDAWIKDLPEEDREELDALRDDRNERDR